MCSTKILLLEDEPIIADDLKKILESKGYRVFHADGAAKALSLCARHLPGFAILNFHQKDSGDGMSLARLLRTRYLVKILFITGARDQDLSGSPSYYAGHEVLHKPYTQQQLRKAFSGFLP
ncbi:MAG TPA: response regulator [Bacteroidetes bacterium]|nr:response regulator [Bacteroidota bacterium]